MNVCILSGATPSDDKISAALPNGPGMYSALARDESASLVSETVFLDYFSDADSYQSPA